MNKKKFVYAFLGVTLVSVLQDSFKYWIRLSRFSGATGMPDIEKDILAQKLYLLFSSIISEAIFALLFVYLFVILYKSWGKGMLAGIKFGLILALLYELPEVLFLSIARIAEPWKNYPEIISMTTSLAVFSISLFFWCFKGFIAGILYKE